MMRHSFIAYDTFCSVSISGLPEDQALRVLDAAEAAARFVESTLSMYDDSSELSVLCRDYEVGTPSPVSDSLFYFLQENLRLSELTGGLFDPTIGKLVKLWDFLGEDREPPSPKELAEALGSSGANALFLDGEQQTVTFRKEGILIDPGASGKGFALDLTAKVLRSQGVKGGICNFGNSLYLMGGKEDGQGSVLPWSIAVQNPDDPNTVIGTIEVYDGAVSTSSWYEHYFEKDGIRYHHILDPLTGMPRQMTLKSVTVQSSSGFYSDLLSTALFILGEEGVFLLDRMRKESGVEIKYAAIRLDGSIAKSEGLVFTPISNR